MKNIAAAAYRAAWLYLALGWPLVAFDAWRDWRGAAASGAAGWINLAAFLWVLDAAALAVAFVVDRPRRERLIAAFCGLRENDEREREVTGDAARTTLLLGLALQLVLMLMSLTTVRVLWNDDPAHQGKRGLLSVGLQFSSSKHLDPFLSESTAEPGKAPEKLLAGGFLLPPATFPVLGLLMLLQIAAFRLLSRRRYEGLEL